MIGAHDTYTYLKSTNWFINMFSLFWKCQIKSIEELYQLGVRVFDIRVIRTKDNKWQCGHGLAKVNRYFDDLDDICRYFKINFKNSYIRIILESGGNKEEIINIFKDEAKSIINKYDKTLWQIYIKSPWTKLYNQEKIKCVDYCCHLFNWNLDLTFKENLKRINLKAWNIKSWAKHNNPKITKEMIDDPNIIHLIDYVGVYPK